MSASIQLAKGLRLPLQVVTESAAILAKRRAGKSTTARRLTEQLHKAKQQVVVADPKGDWWGLLFARDGKSPGLPFVVLGGEHGHIPLEVGAGELVAKMVVTESVSIVLDLSQFRKHEVATFMTAFMENLYRLKAQEQYRTPLMLIIDEADAIAPQKPQKGEERMLGAVEDLVRRGGQRGIGVTMITQRSAVLNKNVLTQIGILIVLRTIAPQDLAAMDAWIDVHGTVEQRKELMASLPSLPIGTGWVWAPGWPDTEGIFQKSAFLLPETFDSSKTPGQSKTIVPKNAADVDLEAFKREMAATIERQKQENPKLARVEITRLNAQVKRLTEELEREKQKQPAAKEKRVEIPVLKDGQITKFERAVGRYEIVAGALAKAHGELVGAFVSARSAVHAAGLPRGGGVPVPTGGPGRVQPRHAAPVGERVTPETHRRDAGVRRGVDRERAAALDSHLPPGEKATLIAAAQYPSGITREQASILTGYKRSSRDQYIQRLQAKGYVQRGHGNIVATDTGVAALGSDYEPLPSGEDLQRYWLERLSPGEKAVLEIAIKHYPHPVDRDSIDEATAYKRSSRDQYIQRLQARQLLARGSGPVTASAVLFES